MRNPLLRISSRMRGLALLLSLAIPAGSMAQEMSYWLQRGGKLVGKCPGSSQGEPLKAANKSMQDWVFITAVIACRDAGSSYAFDVKYLNVSINPRARERINRDTLNFDWMGLAVYKPLDGGSRIEWLYDEARPLRGSLAKTNTAPIYFGNMKFEIPKAELERATHFTLYLTSEGVLYNFELL